MKSIERTYEGRRLPRQQEEVVDQGLAFDVETLLSRRRLLRVAAVSGLGLGLFGLSACGSSGSGGEAESAGATAATAEPASEPDVSSGADVDSGSSGETGEDVAAGTDASAAPVECEVIPEETAGPFPGDGSNGPDVLSESAVVRPDIRSSFGEYAGTAEGIPLSVRLRLVDAGGRCAPLAGAAVYIWHCDREGRYSLYSEGATDQNYLRGVQEADADGVTSFMSIFPGCYQGRWPHIHFEVYPSLDDASDVANTIATSQIALPEDTSNAVYATAGYEDSIGNLAQLTLETDNVFGEDGGERQLGTIGGTVEDGLVVELTVPV